MGNVTLGLSKEAAAAAGILAPRLQKKKVLRSEGMKDDGGESKEIARREGWEMDLWR